MATPVVASITPLHQCKLASKRSVMALPCVVQRLTCVQGVLVHHVHCGVHTVTPSTAAVVPAGPAVAGRGGRPQLWHLQPADGRLRRRRPRLHLRARAGARSSWDCSRPLRACVNDDLHLAVSRVLSIPCAVATRFAVLKIATPAGPQTLDFVFGTALPDTPRDVYLWQLIGAGVSTLVGPIALTQRARSSCPCARLYAFLQPVVLQQGMPRVQRCSRASLCSHTMDMCNKEPQCHLPGSPV